MRFSTWIESEAGLNSGFPELLPPVNRGNSTVASDEVIRTGLQPQVDAEEIHTKQKANQDKIQAIDAAIQRAGSEFPQGKEDDPKLNQFKKMWDSLKKKWDDLKNSPEDAESSGENEMIQLMRRNPNATPSSIQQVSNPMTT